MRRRDLIFLAAAAGGAAGFSAFLRARGSAFEFVPITGVPGFRRMAQGLGAVSGQTSFLVGLESAAPVSRADREEVLANVCGALYGGHTLRAGDLPVAVFGDYYCPNCAELDRRLLKLASQDERLHLIFHELPVLHPRSDELARVALAAGLQSAHGPAHDWLMTRTLPPGPGALRAMAGDLGLDADQLIADTRSPQVGRALKRSAALAAILGIPATPGIVIGSTVVLGALTERDLKRLIKLERGRMPGPANIDPACGQQ